MESNPWVWLGIVIVLFLVIRFVIKTAAASFLLACLISAALYYAVKFGVVAFIEKWLGG